MLGFCNLILPRSAILIFFFLKVAKISLFFLIYPYLCSDPLSKNFIRFQLQLPFCHRKSWKEFMPSGCRAHAVHAGWLRTPTRCMLWQHGGSRAALLCTAVFAYPAQKPPALPFYACFKSLPALYELTGQCFRWNGDRLSSTTVSKVT